MPYIFIHKLSASVIKIWYSQSIGLVYKSHRSGDIISRRKAAKSLNLDVKYSHMIRFLLKKVISRQKELILQEATHIQDFMRLLMKRRNTGKKWTREEKKQLKLHIIHLSAYVPILIIFLLPGGSLLVPILADILERRKKKERGIQQDSDLVSMKNALKK